MIDPAGEPLALADLTARLPGLRVEAGTASERGGARFVTTIRAEGDADAAQAAVGRHLASLHLLSSQYPQLQITLLAVPDGDVLKLAAGSFGDDDAEVRALMESVAEPERWQVYASFKIGEARQPNLLRLLDAVLAPDEDRTVQRSPAAFAIGFDVDGDANQVANLLARLRFAWREEGNLVDTLVEIVGAVNVRSTLRSWSDWVDLEGTFRPRPDGTVIAELRELPELLHIDGSHGITWFDAEENLYGIMHGTLCSLSERRELDVRSVHRRAGGTVYVAVADKQVELPRAEPHVERRLHVAWEGGALYSDTEGRSERATSRLFVVDASGPRELRRFTHARGIDADTTEAFVLADHDARVQLCALHLHSAEMRSASPWSPDEVPTDVAVLGRARVAVTVERGGRSAVYLVERAELAPGRVLAVPCVAPQIVGASGRTLWITGMAAAPGPARCDLFRIDLASGGVHMVTAELDVTTVDVVVRPDGEEALLATPRAVYRWSGSRLIPLVELFGDERVTGVAFDPTTAVFVDGKSGPRLVLGSGGHSVPLPSAGYAPRFL